MKCRSGQLCRPVGAACPRSGFRKRQERTVTSENLSALDAALRKLAWNSFRPEAGRALVCGAEINNCPLLAQPAGY